MLTKIDFIIITFENYIVDCIKVGELAGKRSLGLLVFTYVFVSSRFIAGQFIIFLRQHHKRLAFLKLPQMLVGHQVLSFHLDAD